MFVSDNRLSSCRKYVVSNLVKKGYQNSEASSVFELLAMYFLSFSKVELLISQSYKLSESELLKFNTALKRLKNNEPIQYVIGETEFFGRIFTVDSSVLIPRPETEELVSLIVQESNKNENISILDLGTGSGCIAVSLDLELPKASVSGYDISAEALNIANKNNADLAADVNFEIKNILELPESVSEYNVIVSNPPYVRNLEKSKIEKRVIDYEPHLALFVEDDDPLVFYSAISRYAIINLKSNGRLYLEINQDLADHTKELLINSGFVDVRIIKDLYGNDRILSAKRNE